MKRILNKSILNRSEDDKEYLQGLIKEIKFFKELPKLGENGLREIASLLKIESFAPLEDVIKYGEQGDKFYIILQGVVSVNVPNPSICQGKGMTMLQMQREFE